MSKNIMLTAHPTAWTIEKYLYGKKGDKYEATVFIKLEGDPSVTFVREYCDSWQQAYGWIKDKLGVEEL